MVTKRASTQLSADALTQLVGDEAASLSRRRSAILEISPSMLPEAESLLTEVAFDRSQPLSLRTAATNALARVRTAAAVRAMTGLLAGGEPPMLVASAAGLSLTADESVVRPLTEAASRASGPVREMLLFSAALVAARSGLTAVPLPEPSGFADLPNDASWSQGTAQTAEPTIADAFHRLLNERLAGSGFLRGPAYDIKCHLGGWLVAVNGLLDEPEHSPLSHPILLAILADAATTPYYTPDLFAIAQPVGGNDIRVYIRSLAGGPLWAGNGQQQAGAMRARLRTERGAPHPAIDVTVVLKGANLQFESIAFDATPRPKPSPTRGDGDLTHVP